jgi:anti-sigma28 factor (negative regulator of flagellin synthesis)
MRLHLDPSALRPTDTGQTSATSNSADRSRQFDAGSSLYDSVSVSSTSRLLARSATDRASRIQTLTAAVRSGRYDVPDSKIGGAIVSEALS